MLGGRSLLVKLRAERTSRSLFLDSNLESQAPSSWTDFLVVCAALFHELWTSSYLDRWYRPALSSSSSVLESSCLLGSRCEHVLAFVLSVKLDSKEIIKTLIHFKVSSLATCLSANFVIISQNILNPTDVIQIRVS